uniref:Putative secreted glycine-rich salivary protein n=1 Tax=Amblyomma cajennense TaxID=34607 RepID=A0A023FDY9_AMBCJ
MLTSTRLATLFVVALVLLCSWSPRVAGQGNSYSVSSYHHESYGPDGIVMGRSGYKDSSGKSRFTHYHVGKDGRRKFIRDDPEGDLQGRSLLPDPSKIGFPGFPGLGDPHLDFFRALGFPKGSLFPSFPQDLLPHDLLPPSVASGTGKGVEGRKGISSGFPATTPDFFSGSLFPPVFTHDFFPADLLPKDLLPPNVGTPASSGGAKDKPAAAAPAATTPTIPPTATPQGKRIPPPPVPRTEAEPYRFQ